MDNLDVTDIHYDKKISDLQRRLDTQYDKIDEVEEAIADLKSQVYELKKNQIDTDSIYGFLNALIYSQKDGKMEIGFRILSFSFQYRLLKKARK